MTRSNVSSSISLPGETFLNALTNLLLESLPSFDTSRFSIIAIAVHVEYFENLVEFVFDEDITEGDNDLEVMLNLKKSNFLMEKLEKLGEKLSM